MNNALDSLGFKYIPYNGNELKKYILWIRKHVLNQEPVIVATKHAVRNSRPGDYDHILMVIGYRAGHSIEQYSNNDIFTYNDCHRSYHLKQSSREFSDKIS